MNESFNKFEKVFMAISKKKILETISAMPEDEFSDVDVLFERILLFQKIERAENDIAEGRVYTTDELKLKLAKNGFYNLD